MRNVFRKYRAWHKELEIMLYPPNSFDSMTLCRDSAGNHRKIKLEHEDWSTGEKKTEEYPMGAHMTWDGRWYINGKYQDVIWMQYTGLETEVDKKEIFEGDVLKYKGKIGQVIYESDHGGYILEFKWSKNQHHELLTCDVAFESSHHGNIYEKPELLELINS